MALPFSESMLSKINENDFFFQSLSTVLNKSLSLYSAEDSRARTEGEENEESGEDDLYESGWCFEK